VLISTSDAALTGEKNRLKREALLIDLKYSRNASTSTALAAVSVKDLRFGAVEIAPKPRSLLPLTLTQLSAANQAAFSIGPVYLFNRVQAS
jgi:hypothetical protein